MVAKILIVHDHPLLYEGVCAVLQREEDFEVLGEARTAADALIHCRTHEPDALLVDIQLTENGFAEFVRNIACHPDIRVRIIALTMTSNPQRMRQAALIGAHGIVSRFTTPEELVDAIRTVLSGQMYLDPSVARQMMEIMKGMPEDAFRKPDAGYECLSAREKQVFAMLAEGMTNKDVAFTLGISYKTVETHHVRIYRKLGLCGPLDLVRYAARIGVVDIDTWTSA